MFENITLMGMIPTVIVVMIILFVGFKIGKYFSGRQGKREMKLIDKERDNSNRSYKKLLDDENVEVLSENRKLRVSNSRLMDKINEYRKKLAGIGTLSFSKNRRRADILYSLLLENEALEQILTELIKAPDEKRDYLMHQMKDIGKRHQLLVKIFNDDDIIRNHVKNILFNDKRIDTAVVYSLPENILEAPFKSEKKAVVP
jgi:regulator of replication initiation timing